MGSRGRKGSCGHPVLGIADKVMEYLFWFSILFVMYPYVTYPLLLWLVCFMVKPKIVSRKDEAIRFQPKVTLLISAYNEEDVISEKIENSLKVDYPRNLLEIVVVSDGSNDQTNRIVSTYADKGVVLRFYEGRIGKTVKFQDRYERMSCGGNHE